MPPELGRALMLRALCEMWNYTPQEAERAPAWVVQATNLVLLNDQLAEEATG